MPRWEMRGKGRGFGGSWDRLGEAVRFVCDLAVAAGSILRGERGGKTTAFPPPSFVVNFLVIERVSIQMGLLLRSGHPGRRREDGRQDGRSRRRSLLRTNEAKRREKVG